MEPRPRPRGGSEDVRIALGPVQETVSLVITDDALSLPIPHQFATEDIGEIADTLPILPLDTAGSLFEKLASLGAELLPRIIPDYLAGKLVPKPQPEQGATYAPMLKKEDGLLDFNRPARELVCAVRAYNPWPGAFTIRQGVMLKILRCHAVPVACNQPGKTMAHQNLPAYCTSNGLLVVDELQPAGKKPMPGQVFLQGARDWGN